MLKVFVSHSSTDKQLVDALRELITAAFSNEVEILYSTASVASGGIAAGQSWLEWIHQQIRESDLTIALLTPLSRAQPWLMWEAGAVSGLGLSRGSAIPVVPLLYGIRQEDVPSPLGQSQTKSGTEAKDICDLLDSLQLAGQLTYASDLDLPALIDTYLKAVREIGIPGMYDLFISCPMSSIDGEEYEQMHATIEAMVDTIGAAGHSAYSAIRRIGNSRALDPEDIAAETDLQALTKSRRFLMIYPRSLVSSCLLEAGYALINGIPSTYFVRSDDDLPYMLRGAVEAYANARRIRYREPSQILTLFQQYLSKIIQA
jgi:hypothetical protein